MWTRKELKDNAKTSFKANYWKTVFVALIALALAGGMSFYSSMGNARMMPASTVTSTSTSPDNVNVEIKDGKVKVDVDDNDKKVHVDLDADDLDKLGDVRDDVDEEEAIHAASFFGPGILLAGISLMLLSLIVMAIAIALYVFVLSPLEAGCSRFFLRNLNQRAEVKEIAFGYDNNYKEVVKTLFLRSLFIFLWALLLIIPGIYKAYEYRMIPYLLADDPTMTKDRAFAESKRMMDGQKWNAFVLDLSFLGWNILSALTLGILGVFYVTPYQCQTNAALYEKLRYGLPAPQPAAQAVPFSPVPPANTQVAAPVIVSGSQPPVPPFAQVDAVPASAVPAGEAATTAPVPAADVDPTLPMPGAVEADAVPANDAATTAPIPETGIDPTLPMPGNAENGAVPDSPDA